MPKDIQWHMIGHVQTNKVKFMAPFVSLIHGVDSLKLLKEINKQALKEDRIIDCLLQIHIAEEETKFGLDEAELEEILKQVQTRGEDEQSEAKFKSKNYIVGRLSKYNCNCKKSISISKFK